MAAVTSSSSSSSSVDWPVPICKAYQEDHCQRGIDCDLLHLKHWKISHANQGPNARRNPGALCRYFAWGHCKYGDSCRYVHEFDGAYKGTQLSVRGKGGLLVMFEDGLSIVQARSFNDVSPLWSHFPGKVSLPATNSEIITECPICTEEAETPVRLGCGHTYCRLCFEHWVEVSSEPGASQFPLSCEHIDDDGKICDRRIALSIIRQAAGQVGYEKILEQSFANAIRQNPTIFRYCPGPSCGQVYRVQTNYNAFGRAPLFNCINPECFTTTCAACHTLPHFDKSCSEAQREARELEWRWAEDLGIKVCPRCGSGIEKNEGCNHMTCACGTHICWFCLATFDDDEYGGFAGARQAIYSHMLNAHQSYGDDEAMALMEQVAMAQDEEIPGVLLFQQPEIDDAILADLEAANIVEIEPPENDAAPQQPLVPFAVRGIIIQVPADVAEAALAEEEEEEE
ncbi:MAG: hypothetical protein M1834_004456 [Cirrosporium novae-zelandiae]|nr:MAG: hypothetical protein M1834_004456 [Cirrosporium novae-zelandiae]